MSPDWGLHRVSACVVVGTRAISRGCACGLALMAGGSVRAGRRDGSSNNLLDLTLIPDHLEMRFPCGGELMLTLLWTPSPGMMKRGHAGRLGQISLDGSGPFYIELLLNKGLEGLIGGLINLGQKANQVEGDIKKVTLS